MDALPSPRPTVTELLDDLAAEQQALDVRLDAATASSWDLPTPASGWQVRHQVAHLAQGEELAALAVGDPSAFEATLAELVADLDGLDARLDEEARAASPAQLLGRWRRAAADVVEALRDRPEDRRIGWIQGPMSPRTFATARLMETFAHGIDVADALGRAPEPSGRLRHVADLGVRTRGFSFTNRGLPVPAEPAVVLRSPDGERWRWGPEGAAERVEGDLLDFCLVVTRRRHPLAMRVRATGPGAQAWLPIAQCYAGPPSDGPPPPSDHGHPAGAPPGVAPG